MSADNRLCYMPWGGGQQWYAWHGSGSQNYYEPPANARSFSSFEDVAKWLHSEEDRISYLEYGIGEISRSEQQRALIDAIVDLAQRLANLQQGRPQIPGWDGGETEQ